MAQSGHTERAKIVDFADAWNAWASPSTMAAAGPSKMRILPPSLETFVAIDSWLRPLRNVQISGHSQADPYGREGVSGP
jgi:hypothetical protein